MTPVHLVDDDPAVRDALEFLLGSCGLKTHCYPSGPALLAALDDGMPARGVFLLDVRMEPLNGLRLHDELLARGLRNPVLFLTGHGDIPMVVDALKKGAFDFLEKPYSDNTLVERLRQALAVADAMQDQGAQAAERQARLASLTDREREVLHEVARGRLNKQIAFDLGISEVTVKLHRSSVMRKMEARTVGELIRAWDVLPAELRDAA